MRDTQRENIYICTLINETQRACLSANEVVSFEFTKIDNFNFCFPALTRFA